MLKKNHGSRTVNKNQKKKHFIQHHFQNVPEINFIGIFVFIQRFFFLILTFSCVCIKRIVASFICFLASTVFCSEAVPQVDFFRARKSRTAAPFLGALQFIESSLHLLVAWLPFVKAVSTVAWKSAISHYLSPGSVFLRTLIMWLAQHIIRYGVLRSINREIIHCLNRKPVLLTWAVKVCFGKEKSMKRDKSITINN